MRPGIGRNLSCAVGDFAYSGRSGLLIVHGLSDEPAVDITLSPDLFITKENVNSSVRLSRGITASTLFYQKEGAFSYALMMICILIEMFVGNL